MCGSESGRSEATGDLLLDPGHAYLPLRPVVCERDVGILHKAQDFGFVACECHMQVFGIGLYDAAALAVGSGLWFGEFPFCLGQDGSVAHGLVVSFGQFPAFALADLVGGFLQQLFHALGLGVVVGVDEEPEVA